MATYDNKQKKTNVLVVFTEEMRAYEQHLRIGDSQLGIQAVSYGDSRRFEMQDTYKIVLVVGSLLSEEQRNTVSQVASCLSMKGSYVIGALVFEEGNIFVPDGISAYFSLRKSFLDSGTYFAEFLQRLSNFLMEVLSDIGNIGNEDDEMQQVLYTFHGLLNADWGTFEHKNTGKSITCHSLLNSSYSSPDISSILAHIMVSEEFIRQNSINNIIEWIDLQLKSILPHYLQLTVEKSISDANYFYMWQAKISKRNNNRVI